MMSILTVPATASTCNVLLMRNSELSEGIIVFDKDENVVGSSKVAAKKVILWCEKGDIVVQSDFVEQRK